MNIFLTFSAKMPPTNIGAPDKCPGCPRQERALLLDPRWNGLFLLFVEGWFSPLGNRIRMSKLSNSSQLDVRWTLWHIYRIAETSRDSGPRARAWCARTVRAVIKLIKNISDSENDVVILYLLLNKIVAILATLFPHPRLLVDTPRAKLYKAGTRATKRSPTGADYK